MAATSRKQFGAEEARGAHNPEVPRSKLGIAINIFFVFFGFRQCSCLRRSMKLLAALPFFLGYFFRLLRRPFNYPNHQWNLTEVSAYLSTSLAARIVPPMGPMSHNIFSPVPVICFHLILEKLSKKFPRKSAEI